ncbi:MAG: hypothetical protein FH761_16665 [Firmicutes bacterium]|nr:hypothetical protein [Bacillota bacterium]
MAEMHKRQGEAMKIYEYLASHNLPTLQRIAKKYNFNPYKQNNAEKKHGDYLGDSVENLMSHRSYKRINRRVKQTKWD